jgi:G3E family GTPase
LRSKGFFCFAGTDYKFEFQGVRTSFHSKAEDLWQDGEERKSTVVLIGENLNEEKLKTEFAQCV